MGSISAFCPKCVAFLGELVIGWYVDTHVQCGVLDIRTVIVCSGRDLRFAFTTMLMMVVMLTVTPIY